MILVTGATGNVGGELVRQFVEANQAVRALVRNGQEYELRGVKAVSGDLNRPESLRQAFSGT
jgi:uncharacterized protein YbjT (DUF2867 family)